MNTTENILWLDLIPISPEVYASFPEAARKLYDRNWDAVESWIAREDKSALEAVRRIRQNQYSQDDLAAVINTRLATVFFEDGFNVTSIRFYQWPH